MIAKSPRDKAVKSPTDETKVVAPSAAVQGRASSLKNKPKKVAHTK